MEDHNHNNHNQEEGRQVIITRNSGKQEPGPLHMPLKVEPNGALNLSTGSPSPELTSPASATSPDTSTRMSPGPARSPQGYRPPSYNSVELCVVFSRGALACAIPSRGLMSIGRVRGIN